MSASFVSANEARSRSSVEMVSPGKVATTDRLRVKNRCSARTASRVDPRKGTAFARGAPMNAKLMMTGLLGLAAGGLIVRTLHSLQQARRDVPGRPRVPPSWRSNSAQASCKPGARWSSSTCTWWAFTPYATGRTCKWRRTIIAA